jgi:hypothetical protein
MNKGMDIPGFTAGILLNDDRNEIYEHHLNYCHQDNNKSRTEIIPQQNVSCSGCAQLTEGRHCFIVNGESKCTDVPFDGRWKYCCQWGFPEEYCYLQDCI